MIGFRQEQRRAFLGLLGGSLGCWVNEDMGDEGLQVVRCAKVMVIIGGGMSVVWDLQTKLCTGSCCNSSKPQLAGGRIIRDTGFEADQHSWTGLCASAE